MLHWSGLMKLYVIDLMFGNQNLFIRLIEYKGNFEFGNAN